MAEGETVTWRWIAGGLGALITILLTLAWQANVRVVEVQLRVLDRKIDDLRGLLTEVGPRVDRLDQQQNKHILDTVDQRWQIDQIQKRLDVLERQAWPDRRSQPEPVR